jgi:hypothetical protein
MNCAPGPSATDPSIVAAKRIGAHRRPVKKRKVDDKKMETADEKKSKMKLKKKGSVINAQRMKEGEIKRRTSHYNGTVSLLLSMFHLRVVPSALPPLHCLFFFILINRGKRLQKRFFSEKLHTDVFPLYNWKLLLGN